MRVLVTGASGQLADAVRRVFADRDVIAHPRAALDVTDIDAVTRAVAEARPDAIVNCAAFNQVDAAESRPSEAFAVNAFAVRTLARAAEACGAMLVHYGSDFVFAGLDGPGAEPYDESAAPSPRSVYAASKLVGEWMALEYLRGYRARHMAPGGLRGGAPAARAAAAQADHHRRGAVHRRASAVLRAVEPQACRRRYRDARVARRAAALACGPRRLAPGGVDGLRLEGTGVQDG